MFFATVHFTLALAEHLGELRSSRHIHCDKVQKKGKESQTSHKVTPWITFPIPQICKPQIPPAAIVHVLVDHMLLVHLTPPPGFYTIRLLNSVMPKLVDVIEPCKGFLKPVPDEIPPS